MAYYYYYLSVHPSLFHVILYYKIAKYVQILQSSGELKQSLPASGLIVPIEISC